MVEFLRKYIHTVYLEQRQQEVGIELPRSTDKETQTQSESAEQEAAGLFECEAVTPQL